MNIPSQRRRRESVKRPSPSGFAEPLEQRVMLMGVTIIAHGFSDGAGTWARTMADAMIQRAGTAISATVYTVEVKDPNHADPTHTDPLQVASIGHYGADPNIATNPEIFVLLDWSDVAGQASASLFPPSVNLLGYTRSTADVAAAFTNKLLMPGFLPGVAAPLASFPIDLTLQRYPDLGGPPRRDILAA